MLALRTGLNLFRLLLACGFLPALSACSGDAPFTYEPPPAGVPDTPYWFKIQDSLFWYRPDDSLALVQMETEMSTEQKSAALFAARKLGWRMTVERTRALHRPTDPQELTQTLFTVERVESAVSPVTHLGKFREAFWEDTDRTLMGWLPGLVLSGQEAAQYFWPSTTIVAWRPGMRSVEAEALIDSLGFKIVTPSGRTQHYWVDRTWAIVLPAGADLFTWLRWFNRDPRVHLAHPVLAAREPPVPDQRILRRFEPVPDTLVPAALEKLAASLRRAWEIAQFCGHTHFVMEYTGAQADGQRLRVRITLSSPSEEYDTVIRQAGGDVIESKAREVEAWVPYLGLPACAADVRVKKIEEVRDNLLGG